MKNDGGSSNIEVPVDGYYVITYDMNAETLSVEPYDGLVGVYSMITMPGGYQDWNVSGNAMTPMSTVVENHDWIVKDVTYDNTELKFANGTWAVNWGATTFPVGVGTQGGPNIPVEAGTYTVVFNDILGGAQLPALAAHHRPREDRHDDQQDDDGLVEQVGVEEGLEGGVHGIFRRLQVRRFGGRTWDPERMIRGCRGSSGRCGRGSRRWRR